MKKWISKNIFHISNLINALKKETWKKLFLNLFWFKTNFKKTKIKIFEFIFRFQIKKWISKSSFIFQFFLSNWKMKNENFSKFVLFWNQKTNYTFGTRICLPFLCLIDFSLNFLYLHLFFIFIKNRKGNTVRFSLFILMKKLKNELLEQIKINFMIIITSIVYTLFKSQFVSSPLRFSAMQWSRGHQESAV